MGKLSGPAAGLESTTAYLAGASANAGGTKPWSVRAFTTPRNRVLCVKVARQRHLHQAASERGRLVIFKPSEKVLS